MYASIVEHVDLRSWQEAASHSSDRSHSSVRRDVLRGRTAFSSCPAGVSFQLMYAA